MKKIVLGVLVFLSLTLIPSICFAQEESNDESNSLMIENEVQSQINDLDTSQWDAILNGMSDGARSIVGGKSLDQIISDFATGDASINPIDVINNVFNLLLGEAGGQIGLLISLVALALISGLLTNLRSAFASDGVAEIAHYVLYLMLATILVNVLWQCMTVATDAVNLMVDLMQALFPILITILTAMGNVASAGVFQPMMAMLTGSVASFMRDVVMPMVLTGGLIAVISRMSERFPIKRFGSILNTAVKWTTGIVFTLFLGIMGLSGLNAAALDGLTIKTAKFTIDKVVPMVGGYMSDSMDTILGCSLIVKNATGATGLLSIVAVLIVPLLRLLAIMLVIRIAAALVEPISDPRLSECMDCISSSVTMLFVVVLSVGTMFFISVSLILGAGNVSVMMR